MTLDPSEIEAIRSATFPRSWGWRGYDKAEVQKFLDHVAHLLELNGGGARPAASQEEQTVIQQLEATIESLERKIVRGAKREDKLKEEIDKLGPGRGGRKASPRRSGPRKPTTLRFDVNRATFIQLRWAGLSVAAAARLMAIREVRGGIDSLDVLDELDGVPVRTLAKVKNRLYVDGESHD